MRSPHGDRDCKSLFVRNDVGNLRRQVRTIGRLSDQLVQTAPTALEPASRSFRQWNAGIDTAINALRYTYDPNAVFDTPAARSASQTIRSWAKRNCAQSIDRDVRSPLELSVCLDRSASPDKIDSLFVRARIDGVTDEARATHGVIVTLERFLSPAKQAAIIRQLRHLAGVRVTAGGYDC